MLFFVIMGFAFISRTIKDFVKLTSWPYQYNPTFEILFFHFFKCFWLVLIHDINQSSLLISEHEGLLFPFYSLNWSFFVFLNFFIFICLVPRFKGLVDWNRSHNIVFLKKNWIPNSLLWTIQPHGPWYCSKGSMKKLTFVEDIQLHFSTMTYVLGCVLYEEKYIFHEKYFHTK